LDINRNQYHAYNTVVTSKKEEVSSLFISEQQHTI